MTRTVDPPFLVALNLTRRCNLACAHCYLDAVTRSTGDEDELSAREVKALLDDIAALSDETMVVLTGGEPLLRPDIESIARHGAGLGLMMVVGTNGTPLDEKRVARLQQAGIAGVGISLDSLDPAYHDGFRGKPGAWARTMAAIDACRGVGLIFQIHFSVTDDNADELEDMIDFAREAGALAFNVFFLVCTGRGEKVTNISAETYDHVLRRVVHAAHDETDIMVRAKCAPHFKRMAMELDPAWPITSAHGYEAGNCLAGTRYCRVTPAGEVTPCPYMETKAGSIREGDFATIWQSSPLFHRLREPTLEGRCGDCEYTKICGGCRARPMARDGNPMGEDFLCAYQPGGGAVIEPMPARPGNFSWSEDAEARLKHVPPFVRRFVRKSVEDYVAEQGRGSVTATDMQAVAKRRFGDKGPPGILGLRWPGGEGAG
ncbi:MAG: radical SAM protein [Alphaproteobacteria bacterium]|jgi:radical SAM protein with 4Fe4S-binding SPASM domain|nr:radical SAM protein [Alphaproteobacteria bacterium]